MSASPTPLERIDQNVDAYQSILADCLVWFEGFTAAFAGKESWQQPTIPSLTDIRAFNGTLQELMRDKANSLQRGPK